MPSASPCANASTVSPLVRAAALAKTIMVVRNIVGTPFWDATASIRLTKNSRSFASIAKIRSMLRRRCRVVMDEEYVQEHILTGGISAPVGGASPAHSSPPTALSLRAVASYSTHPPPAARSAHSLHSPPIDC